MRTRFVLAVAVFASILPLLVGQMAHTASPPQQIYVVDRANSRIVRVNDMTGAGWTALGTAGSGPKQFNFPRGIFLDARGRIYVADTDNHRIVRMEDIAGAEWTSFGSRAQEPSSSTSPEGSS